MSYAVACVAGHVDHGKTALVKALTGKNCDTHPEEIRRGITINNGYAYLDLDATHRLALVDVPGHRTFVKTMVAGAHSIDFFMLVVAADDGVMPQTIEHINILKLFGIKSGLVVITKCDLVDDDILDLVKLDIQEQIVKHLNFDVDVVEVSVVQSRGIDALRGKLLTMFNINTIETSFFRMYVDRVFTVKGQGVVVTGTSLGGKISVDDKLAIYPSAASCVVRSLEHHDQSVDQLSGKKRVAINLGGVHRDQVNVGDQLSVVELQASSLIDAYLDLLEDVDLFKGKSFAMVVFLSGSRETVCRIKNLNSSDEVTGSSMFVQIELEHPFPLLYRDRFVIRESSGDRTLGGGVVLDVRPLNHVKRSETVLQHLLYRKNGDIGGMITAELHKHHRALSAVELANILGISSSQIAGAISHGEDYICVNHELFVSRRLYEKYSENLLKAVKEHDQANYCFKRGITIEALKTLLAGQSDSLKEVVAFAVTQLMNDRQLMSDGERGVHISGYVPKLSKQQQKLLEDMAELARNNTELTFLDTDRLEHDSVKVYGMERRDFALLLKLLEESNDLITIQDKLFHRIAVERARTLLLEYLAKNDAITVAAFRDLIGGSRKSALMLLEYFDSLAVTVRQDDYRRLKI